MVSGRFVPKCSRFVPKFESVRTQTADRLIHLFEVPHVPAREQMSVVSYDNLEESSEQNTNKKSVVYTSDLLDINNLIIASRKAGVLF